MITIKPMPGEFFAGHYARYARLMRPLTDGRCPRRAMPRTQPGREVRFINEYLEAAVENAQMCAESYWRRHTLHPLVELCRVKRIGNKLEWEDGILARLPSKESTSSVIPRLCPECVGEDLKSYGFSYWRSFHQVCGVDMCLRHKCALRSSRIENDFTRAPNDLLSASDVIAPTLVQAAEHDVIKRYHILAEAVLNAAASCCPALLSQAIRRQLRGIRKEVGIQVPLVGMIKRRIPDSWANRYLPQLIGAEVIYNSRCSFDALEQGRAPGKLLVLVLAATCPTDEAALAAFPLKS